MKTSIPLAPIAFVLLTACSTYQTGPVATSQLMPTKGSRVAGWVKFSKLTDKVIVTGEITGLAPNTEHGFHVHEKGDCSSGDGMSAGGHFNPEGKHHGSYAMDDHHAGGLKSLASNANGVAKFQYESTSMGVGSGASDVVGHGLIVHRDPDDFKTQPTGNSGPRLACGVIAMN